MADELRAACELCGDTGRLDLRGRCHPTAPLRVVIDGGRLTLRCYVPECDRVVADWPAGLPPADDGAAVDEAWLRAVGGDASGLLGTRFVAPVREPDLPPAAVEIVCDDGGATVNLCQQDGPGAELDIVALTGLPEQLTRGHVRRLCIALGIELPAAATDGP